MSKRTSNGAFCFQAPSTTQVYCGQNAPCQKDSRPAVRFDNDGNLTRGVLPCIKYVLSARSKSQLMNLGLAMEFCMQEQVAAVAMLPIKERIASATWKNAEKETENAKPGGVQILKPERGSWKFKENAMRMAAGNINKPTLTV
jgi:hypothetical protein